LREKGPEPAARLLRQPESVARQNPGKEFLREIPRDIGIESPPSH
jgi:hypothetical protein